MKKYLSENYGLIFECERKYGDDIEDEELSKEKDLILVDFDLGGDENGTDVIKQIRKIDPVTDILYYSSQYDGMMASVKNMEDLFGGAYYIDREFFEDKSHNIVNKLVRRSENIINLRGFVLDSSSDFELRIKNVLLNSWKDCCKKEELESKAKEILKHYADQSEKCCNKHRDSDFTHILSDKHTRISISDLLVLLDIFINTIPDADESLKGFKRTYNGEISEYRNALAHSRSNQIMVNNEEIKVDRALHVKMRHAIAEHDKLLKKIEEVQ